MSFEKYIAFKMLSVIGAIVACVGGVLTASLLVLFRATPLFSAELLGNTFFIAVVGVLIYCLGAFRKGPEQIRRNLQKKNN
jgi:hypothetical protein